jgi:uncharacterized protein
MIELIKQPWHWAVAGTFIGLTVPTLLIFGNKRFGLSSSLRHVCAMCIPSNIPFFQYDWRKELWNLYFVAGVTLGGFIAAAFLQNPNDIVVSAATQTTLAKYGITDFSALMPKQIFSFDNLFTLKGLIFFVLGGFMVGFGTRWANGCTSGHAISGLANFELTSFIATVCFMIGGFVMTWFILPYLF